MIPDFAGKIIESARIDFGLHLRTEDGWMIVIEGPVLVSGPGIAPTRVDPAVADSPLPDGLEGVAGQTITQLLVAREGHLGVQLADRQLSVRADENYEAWHVTGPDGELLICRPGGELTHFSPARRDPHVAPESGPAGGSPARP